MNEQQTVITNAEGKFLWNTYFDCGRYCHQWTRDSDKAKKFTYNEAVEHIEKCQLKKVKIL